MGHGIETNRDFHVAKRSEGQAWHGLSRLEDTLTIDNVANFIIEGTRLFFPWVFKNDKGETVTEYRDSGFMLPVSSDDGLGCGIPYNPRTYGLSTLRDELEIIQRSLSGTKATWISATMLEDRSCGSVTFRLDDDLRDVKIGKRVFKFALNALFDLTHKLARTYSNSNVNTVCKNTWKVNSVLGIEECAVNHSTKISEQNAKIEAYLTKTFGLPALFEALVGPLDKERCNADTARNLYMGYLATVDEQSGVPIISTNGVNTANRQTELFATGFGNSGETFLDALSGFTQDRTRGVKPNASSDDKWKRFVSSEFGQAAKQKEEFVSIVTNATRRAETIQLGVEAFKNREAVLSVRGEAGLMIAEAKAKAKTMIAEAKRNALASLSN